MDAFNQMLRDEEDGVFRYASADLCPDKGKRHTPVPDGYLARHEDAEKRMARGQKQERCPTCGFWAVWRTKGGRRAQGSS